MSTKSVAVDLALWVSPTQSAAVLSASTLLLVIFQVLHFSFLSFVSWLLLALVLVSFLGVKFCALTSRPTPTLPKLELSEARARALVANSVVAVNTCLAELWKLASGKDVKATAKALVALYCIAKVTSWLSFVSLAFCLSLAFFTGPLLYSRNQAAVDQALHQVETFLTKAFDHCAYLSATSSASPSHSHSQCRLCRPLARSTSETNA